MENKTLKFTANLVQLILSGEKDVTWRMFDDKDLKVGDHLILLNKENGSEFGQADIINIVNKKLGELKDIDFDGHEKYRSKEEMIQTYRSYYGEKVNDGTKVKIIKFRTSNEK